jgi:hypothetical protein
MAAKPKIDTLVDLDLSFEEPDKVQDAPETVPAFTVGGKVYTTPAHPSAAEAIRYLRDFRKHGRGFAVEMMMERALGEDAVEALLTSKGFDIARWNKVATLVSDLVFGELEASPKE